VWLKEQKDENLSEDDRKRVAERNRKNADVFGAETMDEGMYVRERMRLLRARMFANFQSSDNLQYCGQMF